MGHLVMNMQLEGMGFVVIYAEKTAIRESEKVQRRRESRDGESPEIKRVQR